MKKDIAVIDLGSSKIAAAVADIDRNGTFSLLGLASVPSRGMTKGEITEINKVVEDILDVVGKLNSDYRKNVRNVFITAKGEDVKLEISRGMTVLSKTPREITKKDVDKCLDVARLVKLPLNRAILQTVVRGFYVDTSSLNIKNPIGLYGVKLEAEVFIVTANQSKLQNISKCIDHAGLLLDEIYLSSLSSSYSVLDEYEREKGTLLIDIGNYLTEIMVFKNGMLKFFETIDKGAKYALDANETIDREKLNIFINKIHSSVFGSKDGFSSVAITGGGALLDGIIEEVEKILNMPVRVGMAKLKETHLSLQDGLIHTATIGLISHLAQEYRKSSINKNPIHKTFRKVIDLYESYF